MIETIVAFVNENYPRYKNLSKNEYFTKAYLVYKFLYETYFKKTADSETIYYILYKGLVDLDLKTNSVILKNHLIFSNAFREFYKRYQKGGGKVYIMDTNMQNSSTIGSLTGIIYWFFHKGVC